MTLLQWFEKGMTFQQYVDSMNVNKDEIQYIFDQVKVEEQLVRKLEELKIKNWKVVTLTADWCGDALLCVPIIQKMMEIAQIETRFLNRDDNLELMDQYLTNGTSRSIPIFIFMDQDGNEMKVWGPRSSEVEAFVAEKKKEIPDKEDPDFQAKQIVVFKEMRSTFMKENLFWDSVMKSVEEKLFS